MNATIDVGENVQSENQNALPTEIRTPILTATRQTSAETLMCLITLVRSWRERE